MLWLFWLLTFPLSMTSHTSKHLSKSSTKERAEKLFSRDKTVTMSRWRRTMSTEVSCNQSPIQSNMTLKGGIQAGYFRKLAEHVAMQLCIELCCEEKGCDVAFMSGKNCYGVQCFSVDLCQSVPAKKEVPEQLMLSHVTIKGWKAAQTYTPHENNKLQCSSTRMKTGVTLRGGLQSGNFTDVGQVDNMPICVKLCCVSEKCQVALLINKNCFFVTCSSEKLCENIPSLSEEFSASLAYVIRKHEKLSKNSHSLEVIDSSSNSQLVCKNSEIFYNTTLKGGYKAGNYTNFGKVANMSECVRLCCGNENCDVALMLENNCFAVACKDSTNCLPVHAKASTSLTALNPRISYITSRSEQVAIRDEVTPNGVCHAGIISYDVTLRGGARAGNFTPHGRVGKMEVCISKCCRIEGCSVAMMLRDICFTVACNEDILCEKKPTATSSNFNPKIAYVFQEKRTSPGIKKSDSSYKATEVTKKSKHYSDLLAKRLNEITESYLPTISIASTFSAFMMRSSKSYKQKHHGAPSRWIIKNNTTIFSNDKKFKTQTNRTDYTGENICNNCSNGSSMPLPYFTDNHVLNSSAGANQPPTLLNNTRNESRTLKQDSQTNKTLDTFSAIGEPSCLTSKILYNVTLRGGIKAGKFKDRGQMDNIKQCVRLCCLLTNCDIAFMLSSTCFSVECFTKIGCEARHARSSVYSPTLCYVTARNLS